jgi:hypothetical protein
VSIKLELEPVDIDLVFLALQTAVLPATFNQVKALMDKISEQGLPQLEQAEAKPKEATS